MDPTIPGKPDESLPGPILLDGFFQSFLLGTIVNQAFKYVLDYRDDSRRKRAFVFVVIILSILQTMLEDYKVWRTLILQRRWSTSRIEWSDLFLNGCICWLCEGFYIRRCWKMMGRNKWILAPLSVLSMVIMAANLYLAIAMGVAFHTLGGTDDTLTASRFLLPSTVVAFSFWIFGSLILEMAVTMLLMVSLWRSKTGLLEVDKTVIKVIHITWESAILPSICMIIAVGLYHAKPTIDDHLVLFFVLLSGKFYTFGMLRTLNSRAKLRQEMESCANEIGRTTLSTWEWDQATLHGTSGGRGESAVSTYEVPVVMDQFDRGSPEDRTGKGLGPPEENVSNLRSFASKVDISTPAMEAQEMGNFRHRVCSSRSPAIGQTDRLENIDLGSG
ncbi:hypothetical protein GALMADRAFT_683195 [Galerina marginata CBS 339.88]|uniref:DUF6534 domain-containing protein n=1 Tax=Galerina marginata (strain CBS 339.88) TaxID=685588 RepID=A0A067TNI9_GALM3|nr:hypothetical protein GALMADRAFT_683195 [Galerina marginata CBS 339.88]